MLSMAFTEPINSILRGLTAGGSSMLCCGSVFRRPMRSSGSIELTSKQPKK